MQCLKCGAHNVDSASYCASCGCQLAGAGQIVYKSYAGFWKRFGAVIIDSILLSIVSGICIAIIISVLGGAMIFSGGESVLSYGILMGVSIYALGFIINWLYFTLMESSTKQATLGKMALGIVVVDDQGNRISFARANGRYWSKILSAMFLCIGYIMAGFTAKKQALHDLIASTLVVEE
jgi:uncharacterized RDD family membrane protein YckC